MEISEKNISKKQNDKKNVSYAKWGIIFIIPFLIAYLVFTLIPQVLTIIYSFMEYYEIGLDTVGPKFIGFQNYASLFTFKNGEISILKYCGNTLILWIINAIPQFVIALLLAVLFTSNRLNLKGQRFFKTIFYLPNVIMASAFALLVFHLFQGNDSPVNIILKDLFGESAAYDFLAHEVSVRSLIAMMNFLMWFGNTTILLMAGIQGIDESLFESARMDGASSLRVFNDITMPLLKPIFTYVFITSLIGGLQMFDVPQVLTDGHGTPDNTSTTIVMLLNKHMSGNRNYGMAGAVSVVLFLFTGFLSIFVFKGMAQDKEDY